ncbi:MAG: hypothetical protein F4X02_11400 [Chloroflexi bacterium]|nr:hypothetical protein [Chloroflexota bacterium]
MGFSEKKWSMVQKIQPGDQLLCYMIKQKCFFAILQVTGKPFHSTDRISEDGDYPARVSVIVVLDLKPEMAVPVVGLIGELSYLPFESSKSWGVHFRGLPKPESKADADKIVAALQVAKGSNGPLSKTPVKHSHDEIQWLLLSLGNAIKLDLWVAKNDRHRSFQGNEFSEFPKLRSRLPIQFDLATQRTIELIDVLWLKGNSIIAAFEIEHTTSIYSGILRMSDLLAQQPNINIDLYIVAPDVRRDKVKTEINRPTFRNLGLPRHCRYIGYSKLTKKIEQAKRGGFLHHLNHTILDELAERLTN